MRKTAGNDDRGNVFTESDLARLRPPADGVERNFSGLLEALQRYRVSPAEQYALICKSNYGQIGHPVWKGIYQLHGAGGKIRMPGRYLLSLCRAEGNALT